MKTGLIYTIIGIGVSSLIGWGAWTTVSVTSAAPKVELDAHKLENKKDHNKIRDKIEHKQEVIEEKLDKIQETIIEVFKEMKK